MGVSWRRAFCIATSINGGKSPPPATGAPFPAPEKQQSCHSLPTTPRLFCRTSTNKNENKDNSECKAPPKSETKFGSNQSSPRSPFSILKNTLRFSRSGCGICLQKLKSNHGMAIYTAECSHAFHFSCVTSHIRKGSSLVCPVCNTVWRDAPLLAVHTQSHQEQDEGVKNRLNSQRHFIEQFEQIHYADDEKIVTCKKNRMSSQRHFVKQSEQMSFADDEKLFTPKYRARFLPIPEEDEEHVSSIGDSIKVDMSLSKEAAVISRGPKHDTYAVVLKVRAPVKAAERRAPIDLVAVLDVSERMAGAKLELLKRAMELVISSLSSADRLSVVAFSSPPKRILPLTRMTPQGQVSARRIISHLDSSRGATVEEALKQATKVLDERRERNPVASIILLSGGQDSRPPAANDAHPRRISPDSSTRFAHIEIPVNSPPPASDKFAKCVGGLLSVVVRDLKVQIELGSGSDHGEITAVYPITRNPTLSGSDCTRLGDIFAEEEREVLIEIRVPTSMIGSHHALRVKHNYKDPTTGKLINGEDCTLIVPYPRTAGSGSPRIVRLRNTFITTRAVSEANRLMERGNTERAAQVLLLARALLVDSGLDRTNELIEDLDTRVQGLVLMKRHLRRHSDLYGFENAGF